MRIGRPREGRGVFEGQQEQNEIHLKNRTFAPEPGIDSLLTQKLAAAARPVFGLVQLIRRPTSEDRLALSESGISLEQYLGGTAYYACFSTGAKAEKFPDFVRWAGPLLPEDKVEASLWAGKIEEWATAEEGGIRVLVYFQPSVPEKEASEFIERYSEEHRLHHPSNAWAVVIPMDVVRSLSTEERVRWIEQGPKPFRPLS